MVGSRAAARNPALARLSLRVSTSGTAALRTVAGGGLAAEMTRASSAYTAAAPRMWDSSSVLPGASTAAVRASVTSAREADAALAPAGAGPTSSWAGPAGGALLAGVRAGVSGNGSVLSLTPDARMLASSSTRFPVYIDPSFTEENQTENDQDFDAVQSDPGTGACNGTVACDTTDCRDSHYNDNTPPYSIGLPVGYDDFQQGACQFKDTDYALYQLPLPREAFASQAVLMRASFQVVENYSSSCSTSTDPTVDADWINGMRAGTGWPGPGPAAGDVTASGPDPRR